MLFSKSEAAIDQKYLSGLFFSVPTYSRKIIIRFSMEPFLRVRFFSVVLCSPVNVILM